MTAPRPRRNPTPERVSLVEASRQTGRLMQRQVDAGSEGGAGPSLEELAEALYFAPGDGRIWLHQQRMLLLHASTFGALRREFIDSLGPERAREILERVGYAQGTQDALAVRSRWPEEAAPAHWAVGPRLHMLEGFLKATVVQHHYDIDRRRLKAEFLWHDSVEADEHLAAFGQAQSPCCWMTAAYACGYASQMFGQLIRFRELECRAAGAPCCRVVAMTTEEWNEQATQDEPQLGTFALGSAVARTQRASRSKSDAAAARPDSPASATAVIGVSPALVSARRQIERVAPTEATVLLRGESGVGKELFASTLHRLSQRRDGPFIAINCAAIPDGLVESELFGVEKGAFTGATASRAGRFERARHGTLFLDEIASMSPSAQGKLLRALQEREFERVGGSRTIAADVRVIAATNVDLWAAVEAGRFRQDLFFRLNVYPIDLPALRERRDDIPFLVDHFLAQYAPRHHKRIRGVTQRAMNALLQYAYPGNVRELQNLVERGVVSADDGEDIDVHHLFRPGERLPSHTFALSDKGRLRAQPDTSSVSGPTAVEPAAETLDALEQAACLRALQACGGNVSAAARQLGVTRATLEYRLRKWGRTSGKTASASSDFARRTP